MNSSIFKKALFLGGITSTLLLTVVGVIVVAYLLYSSGDRLRLYELGYTEFLRKKHLLGGIITKNTIESEIEPFDSSDNMGVDYIWYYFPDMTWSFERPVFFSYQGPRKNDFHVPKANNVVYISGKCSHQLSGYKGLVYYMGVVFK